MFLGQRFFITDIFCLLVFQQTDLHFHLCRDADLLRPEESFCLTERHLSSDSVKASSGEVSPYDNNSPVLTNRLMCKYPEDDSPFSATVTRLSGHFKPRGASSGKSSPTLSAEKGDAHLLICFYFFLLSF